MNMAKNNYDKNIQNWLDMVEYDMVTAGKMLKTGRYVYVLFMCHLAIEKILKAAVAIKTQKPPPKTHDLIYLIGISDIKLPQGLMDFVGIINNTAIVTRYPEDLSALVSNYTRPVVRKYHEKTLELIECIKQELKLKKK